MLQDLYSPAWISVPSCTDDSILSSWEPHPAFLPFLTCACIIPWHVFPPSLLMSILQLSASFRVPLPWRLCVISYCTLSFVHSFTYLFIQIIQQIYIEQLFCARLCARSWKNLWFLILLSKLEIRTQASLLSRDLLQAQFDTYFYDY